MAVPKQKQSKARTRKRRSAHDRISVKNIVWCSNCGGRKLPHRVCLECGQYKGRQIVPVVES